MEFLTDFWMAIVASGVGVFIMSFLVWAVLPLHKGDFDTAPDEAALMNAVRSMGLKNGTYMFPNCAGGGDKEANQKKWKEGPCGKLSIFTGMSMGQAMFKTFLTFLIASVVIAYVASLANLGPSPDFMARFRFAGSVGIATYCFAQLPGLIWFGSKAQAKFASVVDGVLYGLTTGVIFAALWPSVEAAGTALPGAPAGG